MTYTIIGLYNYQRTGLEKYCNIFRKRKINKKCIFRPKHHRPAGWKRCGPAAFATRRPRQGRNRGAGGNGVSKPGLQHCGRDPQPRRRAKDGVRRNAGRRSLSHFDPGARNRERLAHVSASDSQQNSYTQYCTRVVFTAEYDRTPLLDRQGCFVHPAYTENL